MFIALAGLVLLLQSTEPPASARLKAQITGNISGCTRPLAGMSLNLKVMVQCRIEAHGRPRNCRVEDNSLDPKVQRAALCIAEAYSLTTADGSDPAGRDIRLPITLRMNVDVVPQEALPQHLRSQS